MAGEKESFVFYKSFYDAICDLALNGNETKLTGVAKTIFILIKPQILANTKRYENGKKRW